MKLSEWCIEYLNTYKKPFIKPSTYEMYYYALKHIPDIELSKLSAPELQQIINSMIHKNYAVSTINHVRTLLHQALVRAQKLGLIIGFDTSVDVPHKKKARVYSLSPSDQLLIIDHVNRSFYGDLYLSLLYSGCRVGELIALTWSDIDFRNRFIHINKTDCRGSVGSPKTDDSVRDIPISRELANILYKKYHLGDTGRIFRNTLGNVVNYRSLLDSWHHFLEQLGIAPVGLHVLRHTYATNMLRSGVNVKVLSRLLGHSSVAITMDLYCDVLDTDLQAAARQMSDFVEGYRKQSRTEKNAKIYYFAR